MIEEGQSRQAALKRDFDRATERLDRFVAAAELLKSAPHEDVQELIRSIRNAEDPAEALMAWPEAKLGRTTLHERGGVQAAGPSTRPAGELLDQDSPSHSFAAHVETSQVTSRDFTPPGVQ